jgi:hypothetical protein
MCTPQLGSDTVRDDYNEAGAVGASTRRAEETSGT